MRILYVTTIGTTMGFFNSYVKTLIGDGHTIDIATNEKDSRVPECYREWGCKIHHIDTSRSPLSMGNLKAIKQIKRIVASGNYDIVHCHTPVAAMCTRLACRKVRKKGTRVIYTAHGFHFFKGAPLKNWLIFYPVEKVCARFTDVLITINKEDYELAKIKLRAKRVEYVPGVGIDTEAFAASSVDVSEKRREIGVPDGARLLLSVGELNANKNHKTVLEAMKLIGDDSIHYAIAGKGALRDELGALADELGIGQRVHLLGYREDVRELYHAADVFVHPSYREGLPVSVMEAMASGLPVVASRIRGNVDLIKEGGGILVSPADTNGFAEAIRTALADGSAMGEYNKNAINDFSFDVVEKMLEEIYR